MTLQVAATQHHPTGAFFSLTEGVRRSSAPTRDPNLCQEKCFCHVRYHRPVPMLLPLPHPLQKHGPPPAPPGRSTARPQPRAAHLPAGLPRARRPLQRTAAPGHGLHGALRRDGQGRPGGSFMEGRAGPNPPARGGGGGGGGRGRPARAVGARRGFSLLPPRLPPRTMREPVPTVCSQVRRGDEGICSTQQTAKRSPGAKALGGFRGIALQHSRTE